MITGKKNMKCGLLGRKLVHSFSPQIHRELADYDYRLFEISEDQVGNFLKDYPFDGINVTIPYKKAVIPFLDKISKEAADIGAVNTIIKRENCLIGYNTDYNGFLYTVKKSGIEIKNKKVLILGTGGASCTARTVCQDLGASQIVLVSRTGETNYKNVFETHGDAAIIINCTPVGMYPDNGSSPICLKEFPKCGGVIDMIYNPSKTKLLLEAEKLQIPYSNGLPMLVAQAKRACELFTNTKILDQEINGITSAIAQETGNIVLIGMPGCGKSTLGKILSEITGRRLIDSDTVITETYGKKPSSIILEEGEDTFRRIEHQVLRTITQESGQIIATGGGVVTRTENYDLLRQHGTVFFITRPLESLDCSDRPLSQRQKLSELFSIRLPLYRSFCDFEVSNHAEPEKCAQEILNLYRKD